MGTDFFTRLLAEKDQLQDRLAKLRLFIQSDKFKTISSEQQSLMIDQEFYMKGYLEVLNKRIKALS